MRTLPVDTENILIKIHILCQLVLYNYFILVLDICLLLLFTLFQDVAYIVAIDSIIASVSFMHTHAHRHTELNLIYFLSV